MKEALKALEEATSTSKAAADLIKDINHKATQTDEYTYYVSVSVKHRTHFLGFRGEPYYTSHQEARFNQRKYDHDVNAAKASMENAAESAKQAKIKINEEAQKCLSTILSAKDKVADFNTNLGERDISTLSRQYQTVMEAENIIQNNRDAYVSCVNEGNSYKLKYDHTKMKTEVDSISSIKANISRAAQARIDTVKQEDRALRTELECEVRKLETLVKQSCALDVKLTDQKSCTAEAKKERDFWRQKDQVQQEVIFRIGRDSAALGEEMSRKSVEKALIEKRSAEMQSALHKLVKSANPKQRSNALLNELKKGQTSDLTLIDTIKIIGFDADYLAYLAIKEAHVGALNLALSRSKVFDIYTNVKGETLLQYAINNDKNTVIATLLAAHNGKYDFTISKALSQDNQKTIGFLIEQDSSLVHKLFYGQSLFEIAVTENKLAIANYLRSMVDVEQQIVMILDRMDQEGEINTESIVKLLRFGSSDISAAVMYFALEKEMMAVVSLLMQDREEDLQECLLRAVNDRNRNIVDKLLALKPSLQEEGGERLREFLSSEEAAAVAGLEAAFEERSPFEWIGADEEGLFFNVEDMGDYWDMNSHVAR